MAPTKSNRKADAKPAPLRKSTLAGTKPPPNPNDKENKPSGGNGRESLLQAETDDVHEQNWWAINVEKAAALIERCMKEYGWERDETKRIFAAYRQFLLLKKEQEDWDEKEVWPCWPVDRMWGEHSTMDDYSTDMRDLLGHVLSRRASFEVGEEERMGVATKEALKDRFGAYDEELWHDIEVEVKDQLGDVVVVNLLNRREPLSSLMNTYCRGLRDRMTEEDKMAEEDIAKLQFEFDGRLLNRDDTFIRLGIEDGETVAVSHVDKVAVTIRYSPEKEHTVLADKTTMISKIFDESDDLGDFAEERTKNVFLYGQRRIYGFESPLALDMKCCGNVIDAVDIGNHKGKNCVCCNPDGDAGAPEDCMDDESD